MPQTPPASTPAFSRARFKRDVLLCAIINTLVGTFFALQGSPIVRAMVTTHTIGFTVLAVTLTAMWLIKPSQNREIYVYFGAVVAGTMLGLGINFSMRFTREELEWALEEPRHLFRILGLFMVVAGMITIFLYSRIRAARLEAAFHAEQSLAAAQARQLAEAQLKMLQAQIEPHFLFNTLANVQSLIDIAPAEAKRMLMYFNDYLRASLARSRDEHGTLKQECDLLRAYLSILQIRMADRLRFRIDCPAELQDIEFAPMLLQPLVENAICHGLEPKLDGGEIEITARREAGLLKLSVRDNGLGLGKSQGGSGLGLANVRERLTAIYGPAGQLALYENQPVGVIAEITLPCTNPPP